jgi:hypothetical protein
MSTHDGRKFTNAKGNCLKPILGELLWYERHEV